MDNNTKGPDAMMTFQSYAQAKAQIGQWKAQYPNARFRIEQIACGNKMRWQVVQTNRFNEEA